MNDTSIWLQPLLLIPGVGLLIMSTSARYVRLHDELHHHASGDRETLDELVNRGLRFRNALVALYASVGLLSIASLVGAALATLMVSLRSAVTLAVATAIGLVTFAAVELVREAAQSHRVLLRHARPEDG